MPGRLSYDQTTWLCNHGGAAGAAAVANEMQRAYGLGSQTNAAPEAVVMQPPIAPSLIGALTGLASRFAFGLAAGLTPGLKPGLTSGLTSGLTFGLACILINFSRLKVYF